MKQLTVKALLAIAVMAASGAASAVQVYMVDNGGHSASSGGAYGMWDNGSTATWDYTGGILTQTGGTLNMTRRSPASSPTGTPLYTDLLTGLIVNTNTGTTTAASYTCVEGSFGGFTGGNICGNYSYTNAINDSTLTYNVGGNADCVTFTQGGDDGFPSNPGPATGGGMRGLTQHGVLGEDGECSASIGSYDVVNVAYNNLGTGGLLYLWNAIAPNSPGPGSVSGVSTQCIGYSTAGPNFTSTACNGAHWLGFSLTPTLLPVPVPAAVWLFGSSLGLLGLARRRRAA